MLLMRASAPASLPASMALLSRLCYSRRANPVAEVLGPAGSGKTTLVRVLRERGIVVRDQLSLPWPTKLRSGVSIAMDLLPGYVEEGWRSRALNLEEFRRLCYVKAWPQALSHAQNCDRAITLLDHGPLFMLGMVYEFGPPFVRSRRVMRWFEDAVTTWRATLDVVLWLDAPDLTLIQRIQSRERPHVIKDKPPAEASAWIQRCRSAFEHFRAPVTARGGPMLLSFDTSHASPSEIAEHFLRSIGFQTLWAMPSLQGQAPTDVLNAR